jgi:hypothetical protein
LRSWHINKHRILTLAVLGLVGLPTSTWADGITVSPVIVDQEVKKTGETLSFDIKNGAKETFDFSISFKPLGHDPMGAPTEMPSSFKYSAEKMLSTKTPTFTLKPGESKKVAVRIDVPPGRTGGAYAMMYVLGTPKSTKDKAVAVLSRFGVIIELTLPGAKKAAFTAGKIDATQKSVGGDVMLLVPVTSTGDIHVKTGGSVSVTDDKGKEVAKIPLTADNVFPSMVRYIKGTWKAPTTMKGKYKLTASVTGAGGTPTSVTGAVEFLKPGELAQYNAEVRKFALPNTAMKKAVALEANVMNKGNLAFATTNKARVTWRNQKTGEIVATGSMAPAATIAVNDKGTFKGTLAGGLPVGAYRVELEVMSANDRTIAKYMTTQQVIEKEVKMAAKITKISGPGGKQEGILAEFENLSNVEVDAGGRIEITDSNRNTTTIGLDKRHVKVGEKMIFNPPVPADVEPGNYTIKVVIDYGVTEKGPISVEQVVTNKFLTPSKK